MSTKKEKIIEKAQKFMQKGNIDKAAAEYQKAVELDPSDVTTRLRLGDLHVKLNDKESAIKEYTEVAKVHTNKGFYLKAIAVYKQMIKLDDSVLEYKAKLADLYAKQHLLADAIREYTGIMTLFEKKNKPSEALEIVKKMVEIDENNLGVRLKLADMYMKSKFEKDAMVEYEWVAGKLTEQGKMDKVGKLYEGLYKGFPKNPLVLNGLIVVCQNSNDTGSQVKYTKELINIYKDEENYDDAIAACEDILRIDPSDQEVIAMINEIKPGYDSPLLQGVTGGADDLGAVSGGEEPLMDIDFGGEAAEEEPLMEMPAAETPAPAAPVQEESVDLFAPVPEEEPVQEEEYVEELDEIEDLEPLEDLEVVEEVVEEVTSELSEDTVYEETTSGGESGGGGFIDLSAELGLDEAFDALLDDFGTGGDELKEGMEEQRANEDSETHYNLGIAYMEMELHEEASNEFKIAMTDPSLEFDCLNRLAMCYMIVGSNDGAIDNYLKALQVPAQNEEARKGTMYELALAYESAGRVDDAFGMYKTVFEMDPSFREIAEKYSSLEEEAKKKLTS